MHDHMSVKPCENYNMIIVNYVDTWLVYSHVASLLDSARLELRELKAYSSLLGAYTSCSLLIYDLKAFTIEIKDLKYKLNHSSHYTILCHPCVMYSSLKGKFFYATKENMSFASAARELRRGSLSMLETHIMMSSLIFLLSLTLVLRHVLLLVLCLNSLMDLTIAHTVLVHERTTLCLDALVMAHTLIVVIVSHVGLV
jgi:hypothetical protein